MLHPSQMVIHDLIHSNHTFCCSSQSCTYYRISLPFIASVVVMFAKRIIYMSALILFNLPHTTSTCIPLKYFVIAHLKPKFHTQFVGIFITNQNIKFKIPTHHQQILCTASRTFSLSLIIHHVHCMKR